MKLCSLGIRKFNAINLLKRRLIFNAHFARSFWFQTLVESGEMILSDGRRIVSSLNSNGRNSNKILLHPDFRMIVLANRPGFPFLGNDFFGALGDLFSTHTVDNPSVENEIQLLRQYGPNVDEKVIFKLVKAFGKLRSMADQGLVSYPYSTREVVNIVKHLEVSLYTLMFYFISSVSFIGGFFLFTFSEIPSRIVG